MGKNGGELKSLETRVVKWCQVVWNEIEGSVPSPVMFFVGRSIFLSNVCHKSLSTSPSPPILKRDVLFERCLQTHSFLINEQTSQHLIKHTLLTFSSIPPFESASPFLFVWLLLVLVLILSSSLLSSIILPSSIIQLLIFSRRALSIWLCWKRR